MPQVPTYDNFQVQPGEIPGARAATPDLPVAAGQQASQMGQALTQAGSGLGEIAKSMAQDANRARMNEASSDSWSAAMSRRAEFSQLQGKDALNRPGGVPLFEEYTQKLQGDLQKIRAGLGNEAQRAMFDQESEMVLRRFQMEATSYTIEQQQKYQKEAGVGAIETAGRAAVSDPYADNSIHLNAIRNGVADLNRGAPKEYIDAKTQDALTGVHAQIIDRAITDGNLNFAQQYLKDHNDEITPDVREKAALALDTAGNMRSVQAFADKIDTKGTPMDDALQKARDSFGGNPKAEKMAVEAVQQRYREQEAANAFQQKQLKDQGWSEVMTNGNLSPQTRSAMASSAPEALKEIVDWQHQKAKQAAEQANDKFVTDQPKFRALLQMKENDPDAFAQVDLNRWSPYLNNADFKWMTEQQGKLRNGDDKALADNKLITGALKFSNDQIRAAGINLNAKPGSAQADQAAAFTNELHRQISLAQPKSQDEANKIAARMTTDYIRQGSGVAGFGVEHRRGYEISSNPDLQSNGKTKINWVLKPFAEIPATVRNQIASQRFPTVDPSKLSDDQQAEIERMYTRFLETQ